MDSQRSALGWIGLIASWVGIVLLGLITGILEDVMFVAVLVPNMPASLDLTGDMFWIFTVPLAELMALAVTGTIALFLGLRRLPRLITFWLCWMAARSAFLVLAKNPAGDIMVYLAWITLWCALIYLSTRIVGKASPPAKA
ncbi:MAG: hypothetical protein AAFO88_03100 [Pseudomonadota bacterium]